jgi:hypothetical protein
LWKKAPVCLTKTALRFWFAQGIEAEIPQAPPNIRTRKRVEKQMRHGVAPANAAVRKKRGTALAAPARAAGAAVLERKARFPARSLPRASGLLKCAQISEKKLRKVKLLR